GVGPSCARRRGDRCTAADPCDQGETDERSPARTHLTPRPHPHGLHVIRSRCRRPATRLGEGADRGHFVGTIDHVSRTELQLSFLRENPDTYTVRLRSPESLGKAEHHATRTSRPLY